MNEDENEPSNVDAINDQNEPEPSNFDSLSPKLKNLLLSSEQKYVNFNKVRTSWTGYNRFDESLKKRRPISYSDLVSDPDETKIYYSIDTRIPHVKVEKIFKKSNSDRDVFYRGSFGKDFDKYRDYIIQVLAVRVHGSWGEPTYIIYEYLPTVGDPEAGIEHGVEYYVLDKLYTAGKRRSKRHQVRTKKRRITKRRRSKRSRK